MAGEGRCDFAPLSLRSTLGRAGRSGPGGDGIAKAHGVPVKWLGDGVMIHYREPAGAVLSALRLVAELPEAGLPPVHVGVAAGPVVVQGGDYFGRTVNLAARLAAHAQAGQVLVSQSVAEAASLEDVSFVGLGELPLKGSNVRCGCWRPAGRNVAVRTSPRRDHQLSSVVRALL